MRLLRKTGARSPWQPSPVLEQVIVGSDRPEPALLIQGQQPTPDDPLWFPQPLRSPAIDMPRPIRVYSGQQPTPEALSLRVSRPAILEDVNRPARPAQLIPGWQPTPLGLAQSLSAPRDQVVVTSDRAPAPSVIPGDQPTPTAQVWLGRLLRVEADKLPRPAVVGVGYQPTPLSLFWSGNRPFDADKLPTPIFLGLGQQPLPENPVRLGAPLRVDPSRLPTSVQVVSGQQVIPNSLSVFLKLAQEPPLSRPASVRVISPYNGPLLPGQFSWLRPPIAISGRARPISVISTISQVPQAQTLWLCRPIDLQVSVDRLRLIISSNLGLESRFFNQRVVWTPRLLSSGFGPTFSSASIYGPGTKSRIDGPKLDGLITSSRLTGKIRGE